MSSVEAMPGHIGIIESGGAAKYDFKILDKLPLSFSASFDYINIVKPRYAYVPVAPPGIIQKSRKALFGILMLI